MHGFSVSSIYKHFFDLCISDAIAYMIWHKIYRCHWTIKFPVTALALSFYMKKQRRVSIRVTPSGSMTQTSVNCVDLLLGGDLSPCYRQKATIIWKCLLHSGSHPFIMFETSLYLYPAFPWEIVGIDQCGRLALAAPLPIAICILSAIKDGQSWDTSTGALFHRYRYSVILITVIFVNEFPSDKSDKGHLIFLK